MPRFFVGWLLGLAGAAIGLLLCNLILGDNFKFSSFGGFLIALVIFAILSAIIPYFILKALLRNAGSIVALTGLLSTFIALFLTALTPWLDVSGFSTWLWATLIIWVLGMFIWLIPGPWRNFERERRDTTRA